MSFKYSKIVHSQNTYIAFMDVCVCMEVVGVWGGVESQLVRGKRTGLRSSPTMRCVPHFGFLNLAYGTFSFS